MCWTLSKPSTIWVVVDLFAAGPWLSKHNFLGLGSIVFKVIGISPLFDVLDLGFEGILIIGRDYKVCVVSILDNVMVWGLLQPGFVR